MSGRLFALCSLILAEIQILRRDVERKPAALALALPSLIREGKPMPNFELADDTVATITILTQDSAGVAVPPPAGDVFTATGDAPNALAVSTSTDANGNPVLILQPLVQAHPGANVTVSDSKGLTSAKLVVDIVPDINPTNIVLDTGHATLTPQPVPTAPGP